VKRNEQKRANAPELLRRAFRSIYLTQNHVLVLRIIITHCSVFTNLCCANIL